MIKKRDNVGTWTRFWCSCSLSYSHIDGLVVKESEGILKALKREIAIDLETSLDISIEEYGVMMS